MTKRWIGPREIDSEGTLLHPVPPERWPFGLPEKHEAACQLHAGGLYCDCKASDASDKDFGESA